MHATSAASHEDGNCDNDANEFMSLTVQTFIKETKRLNNEECRFFSLSVSHSLSPTFDIGLYTVCFSVSSVYKNSHITKRKQYMSDVASYFVNPLLFVKGIMYIRNKIIFIVFCIIPTISCLQINILAKQIYIHRMTSLFIHIVCVEFSSRNRVNTNKIHLTLKAPNKNCSRRHLKF